MKRVKTNNKTTSPKTKIAARKGVEKPVSAQKQSKSDKKKTKTATKLAKTPASKSSNRLTIDRALRTLAAAKDIYDKMPPQLRAKVIDATDEWLNRQDAETQENKPQESLQKLESFSLSLFSNSFDEAANFCSGLFGDNFYWQGRSIKERDHPIRVAVNHVPIGSFSETAGNRRLGSAVARADFIFAAVDGGAATLSRSTVAFCKWALSAAHECGTPLLFVVLNTEENLTYGHEFVSPPGMRRRWADLMKRRKTVFVEAIGCGRERLLVVSRIQEIGLKVVASQALRLLKDKSKRQILSSAFAPDLVQSSKAPAPSTLRKLFKGAGEALRTSSKRAVDWVRENPELAAVIIQILKDLVSEVWASNARNGKTAAPKRRASARQR